MGKFQRKVEEGFGGGRGGNDYADESLKRASADQSFFRCQ